MRMMIWITDIDYVVCCLVVSMEEDAMRVGQDESCFFLSIVCCELCSHDDA